MKAAIAQYYPGHSPLHRLDPRSKFVAVSALAVALFVRDSFAGLAVFAAAAVVAYALSGVPASWFWRAFRPLLWLVGLTFLAQMLFAPGEPFFSAWIIHLSWRGLELAAFLSLRLVVLVLIGSVLFFLVTNFTTWLGSTMYPQTGSGLVAAYVAGIPFFKWTVLGTLFYAAAMFGGFALLRRQAPTLRAQTV